MIRTLAWFDIPMSLANGRIAKVTFEKGAMGSQIIDDVFNEWQAQQGAGRQAVDPAARHANSRMNHAESRVPLA